VDGKLFGRYTHFTKLKAIVEKEGKELVFSGIGEFTDDFAWAITYGGEQYHFSLAELYDTTPKKLYERASKGLSARLLDLHEKSILVHKAKSVFVGMQDSIDSGNCVSGTKSFCSRFKVDTNKIGGLRGDLLLEMDYSSFTRRAVMSAIRRNEVI
jgi:hypothetical protein